MSGIKIPVSADFDASQVQQQLNQFQKQINDLGKQIAQTNKVKFNPVTKASIDDMQKFVAQFEALKKVSGDLNKRINATGQQGKGFFDLDWSKMYPDQASMRRQQAKAFQYVTGSSFDQPAGGGSTHGRTAAHMAGNAARSGLDAMGPAGRVASNAIGTGMSSGFGAGVAGLLGGMLALGVSKIVGAAMEKLDEAEKNSIANDRLKRQLGDVNVSFDALNKSVQILAQRNHLLYSEAGQLAQQFTKVGNVSERQYKTLADEVGTGVGMSRSFGLDPSQGVGTLATFRGMRVTGNDQDTRRMALLIGETIGKADAFAKSGEVMDALASFATNQTRMSLGGTPMNAYAGYLSAMAGSGIPGLDVQNSSAILSRVISTLQNGGGAGEASQFFSARIAQRNGLNPIAGAIWRENPMASINEAFGPDTAMGKFLGKRGVNVSGGAGGSFYAQTLEQLKSDYKDPFMLLNATSRHLGVSHGQAAALLDIAPNQMGELQSRLGKFDLKSLNSESIATMGKLLNGNDNTFNNVASELKSRTGADALTPEERKKLDAAMSGSRDDKINTLMSLVASRGQEQTQGKDIHDSKTALENMKTMMASMLIPYTQDIRTGILWMAGDRKMTGSEVLQDIANKESELRIKRIRGDESNSRANADKVFAGQMGGLYLNEGNLSDTAKNSFIWRRYKEKLDAGTATDEDRDLAIANLKWRSPSTMLNEQGQAELARLEAARDDAKKKASDKAEDLLKAERDRIQVELKSIEAMDRLTKSMDGSGGKSEDAKIPANYVSTASYSAPSGGGRLSRDPGLMAAVADAEREIGAPAGFLWAQMGVESNYNPNARSPAGAMGLAQVMPGTLRNLERRFGRTLNPYDSSDSVFIQKEVMRENYGRFGNWDDAARAYNGGWSPQRWGNPETSSYVPKIYNRMRNGMPLPDGHQERKQEQRFIFDAAPIEVIHKNERGQEVMPPQQLATRVQPAVPTGLMRNS